MKMFDIIKAPLRPSWHRIVAFRRRRQLIEEEQKKQKFLDVGGSYLDWYAQRLNREATSSNSKSYEERNASSYMASGQEDLDALIAEGMAPHNTLFELGLGWGRSARHFINYLDQGNYVGCDPASARIEYADYFLKRAELNQKNYELICNKDNSFEWNSDRKFDYAYANSVFTHMPITDICEIFENLPRILNFGGKFLFSYRHTAQDYIETLSAKNFRYKFEDFAKITDKTGFTLDDVTPLITHEDYPNYSQYSGLLKATLQVT